MKIATLREFKSRGVQMLQGKEPVLVTENGKPLGVVQPLPDPGRLPLEVRRKLYRKSIARTNRKLDALGITEEQLQSDIAALRKNRR